MSEPLDNAQAGDATPDIDITSTVAAEDAHAPAALAEAMARVQQLEARCESLQRENEQAYLRLLQAEQQLAASDAVGRAGDDAGDAGDADRLASEQVVHLQATIDQMVHSSSWRVTKPWRAMGRTAHRWFGR